MKTNILKNGKSIPFSALEQLEREGNIEDFDLFRVLSKHFNNMYAFYMDGQYYLITKSQNDFREIDRSFLYNRHFIFKNNNVQDFIRQNGIEKFCKLNTKDFLKTMIGEEIDFER